MYNLVQAQEALQGMPTADVMKYANQQNPQVPAYLALSELNRRKQLEQTQSAFSGQPQTVKEQIEGAFTQAPQGQVNPSLAPRMVNPAGARPNAVNPTALPPQLAPETPVPVNPTQAPPAPQMAEGGLASLPLHKMFRNDSYATGGIVAFGTGTEDKNVKDATDAQLKSDRESFLGGLESIGAAAKDIFTMPVRAGAGIINNAIIRPARAVSGSSIPYIFGSDPNYTESMTPYYDKIREREAKEQAQLTGPTAADKEDANAGAAARALAESNAKKRQVADSTSRVNNPSAPPAAPPAPATPAQPTFSTTLPKAEDLTDEELYNRQKKLQQLAGVSQDPYADYKKRLSDIEAKRAKDAEGDALRGLAASLSGYATAAPEKGGGYAAAMMAEAGGKFDKETAALRDKQAMEMAELNRNLEKEDDARRRGDVAGVEAARAAQAKNRLDIAKLETERVTAGAHVTSAEAAKKGAEAQWYHATHPQASQTQQLIDLYTKAPEVFNALHPKENPLVTTAAKNYFENETILKKEFPTVQDYLAAKGLTSRTPSAPKVMTMADVQATAKARGMTEQQVIEAAKAKGYTIQ
jgi:hypothetical protein